MINTDPDDPLFGGGTDNIAFLLGDKTATAPNANAIQMTAIFWIETVSEQITVPARSPDQPVIVQGDASAGNPVASFAVTSSNGDRRGYPDRRHVHADPVHTNGLPELQRPDVAARLSGDTGTERPYPDNTVGLQLSDPRIGAALGSLATSAAPTHRAAYGVGNELLVTLMLTPDATLRVVYLRNRCAARAHHAKVSRSPRVICFVCQRRWRSYLPPVRRGGPYRSWSR